ncbi:MAG: HD domain-containing protein [Nitrospirae bacterium]|nr:HD domain-containing protein [Nitrospirota bacterium]MDA1305138.1 HD domain-containing protein [Nitrospirota bacterium]
MRRHDSLLVEHGKRTSLYSLLLGRAMNMPDDDLSDLCHAALLHDLGKLTLPNEVIHQNGLSMIGEYLMTECSPQAGAEILHSWPELQNIAKLITLHHERWDGSGTPFGMRGTLIPLGARILSLTDTVDQLFIQKNEPIPNQIDTMVRIFRTLSGTRFDPKVVEAFVEVFVPWIERIGLQPIPDCLWPQEPSHSPSIETLTDFTVFLGGKPPTCSRQGSFIDIHLIDIFELTNSIAYNSAQALPER